MKENESQVVKGIAILAMVFYNLFSDGDRLMSIGVTGIICSNRVTVTLASVCHVCVPLFLFVMVYGLSMEDIGAEFNKEQYIRESLGRYVSFLKKFWWIYFPCLVFPYIIRQDYNMETAFGKGMNKRFFGFFGNLIGLPGIFGAEQYNKSWCYITFIFIMFLIIPLLNIVVKKMGVLSALILSIMLPCILRLGVTIDIFLEYIPVMTLAVAFAQYSVFEKLIAIFKGNRKFYILTVFLLMLTVLYYSKAKGETKLYLIEGLFSIVVILLTLLFVSKLLIINSVC